MRTVLFGGIAVALTLVVGGSALAQAPSTNQTPGIERTGGTNRTGTTAAGPGWSMRVNGQLVQADAAPALIDGAIYVPVRFVGEYLAGKVDWTKATQRVDISQPTQVGRAARSLTMFIGKNEAIENGERRALATPPVLRDGRTFVPLRQVARFFNANIVASAENRTIFVTTPNGSLTTPAATRTTTSGSGSGAR